MKLSGEAPDLPVGEPLQAISSRSDQDGTEVVDVGQRRIRDHSIAQGLEESVTVVDRLRVLQGQFLERQGEQGRSTTGDQAQHHVVSGQTLRQIEDASSPAASGTGWAASTISMRRQGTP